MIRHIQGLLTLLLLIAICGCSGGASTDGDPLATDSIKVEASVTSVSAGQESVITATVVRLNGFPATDRSVAFTFHTNNTGGTLRVVNEKVDGQSKAVAVYTAGSNSPFTAVADTIQASLSNDAAAVVVITRSRISSPVSFTISSLEAKPATLAANQTSIITATVTDTDNKPVSGKAVSFSIPVRNSGSPTLTAYNGVSDSNGIVTTIYSPGTASPANQVDDAVQASLADGSSRAVVITRTGQSVTPLSISLAAPDPPSVNAGGVSVITATLTGDNIAGVIVTFSLPLNNSGATLSSSTATTDGLGKAVVIYQAGANSPTVTVQDVVRAAVGSASDAKSITRTGQAVAPPLSISLAAPDPTSVNAGGVSVITATLTGDNKAGVTVTFSLPINNSGATLSSSTAITDGLGKAVVIYQAGANSPTIDVQDVVRAAVGSASDAKSITRTGQAVAPPLSISLAAPDPTSVNAGGVSVITATLTGENKAGVTVTFSLPINNSGATLSSSTAITDGLGKAVVIYKAGANSPTFDVQDVVRAAVGSASDAKSITRTGQSVPPVTPLSISLAAPDPASVNVGGVSVITATLTGDNKVGVTVTFSLPINNSGATLSSSTAITDGAGKAVVIYKAGASSPTISVQDVVRAAVGSASDAKTITRTGVSVTPLSISLAAPDPTSVNAGGMSVITATLTGDNKAGVAVTFSLPVNTSGATLSPSTAITDGSGKAVVIYQAGALSPTIDVQDVVRASVGTASDAKAITRKASMPTSYAVTLSADHTDFLSTAGVGWTGQTVGSVLTATVSDSSGQAVTGMTVTFSIVSGGGTFASGTAVTGADGKAVTAYSKIVTETAGTTFYVFLKATLPDGTAAILSLRIDA
jgi:adhesin/invasin